MIALSFLKSPSVNRKALSFRISIAILYFSLFVWKETRNATENEGFINGQFVYDLS